MKKVAGEFRKFITRGSVVELAVGVIIGAAFTAIVNSLVNDIIMPLISLLTGGFDFTKLSVVLGEGDHAATLTYGAFIAAIINFILIALVLFLLVKAFNRFHANAMPGVFNEEDVATKTCPYCQSAISKDAKRCPNCTSILDAEILGELPGCEK